MKSSFIRLNQLSRAFPYRGSMTKGFKYSIFLAFGNCSSQSNDARVLASKGAFGTCPGRELDSWMAILFYYWQFFALGFFCLYSYSWPLTWALRGSAIQVPIQPSSSPLFSLRLVSGDFRIQARNSMNQSDKAREITRERVMIGLSLTYNYIANRSFFTVWFLLFTSHLRRCWHSRAVGLFTSPGK